jgi:glyoxylase-like metal-dependent hydrolase (beta-lactamase superfamily II)
VTDRYAWTSGIEQVTPSIHRIPLPLPNDGLRAVNIYAIQGPDGIGLIDGGWFIPKALDTLRNSLAEIGAGVHDITTVLATHFHRDHYTLAIELRRLTGCTVALGAAERATIDAIMSGERALDRLRALMCRAGAPAMLTGLEMKRADPPQEYEHPTSWLADGDRPVTGGRPLEALSTPGHTTGHFCFADDASRLLFAGDHVLPHITPSIGFETVPAHLPLANYLRSLLRVRERADAMLLPAHGPVTPSVHARADELLAHHDTRLRCSGDAVAAGARTAYQVAERIPWTRHQRPLGELAPFDQLMAVAETFAHLEVLCLQGKLTASAHESVDEFGVA